MEPELTPATPEAMPNSGPSEYQKYADARRAGASAPAVPVSSDPPAEPPASEPEPPAPQEEPATPAAPLPPDVDEPDEEAAPDEDVEAREQRQTRNRSRNQRRMTAALRRQHKAEFERDQLAAQNQQIQERLAALERGDGAPAPPPAAPATAAAPADVSSAGGLQAPKEEDFERYSDYVTAVAKHELAIERAAQHAERIAVEERSRATEVARVFTTRQQAARDKYADYDAVVNQPLPVNPAIVHAIRTREAGPEVAYFLGKHPQECARIAQLPNVDAMVEIGRLEAQLRPTTTSAAPARPSTSAPAPLSPVGGHATRSTTSPDKLSYQDYKAKRLAEGRR
jgi:hypothetical protein